MKLKVGDTIVCKKFLEYTEANPCYPNETYTITKTVNNWNPLGSYYIINQNRAVFLDDLEEYFYSKKELRKLKLNKLNIHERL